MVGITLNLSGGILYTMARFQANTKLKEIIKRIASSKSFSNLANGYAKYMGGKNGKNDSQNESKESANGNSLTVPIELEHSSEPSPA